MAQITATDLTFNSPNFVGPLYLVTPTESKFLSMIGGITGGKTSRGIDFSWQTEVLAAASQPAHLEDADPTDEFYDRAEVENVVQIFKYSVGVSYEKQATTDMLGIPGTDAASQTQGNQPVADELRHQTMLQLKQMAIDVNYTFLNGTYQRPTTNATARQTRGLIAAITTNATDNLAAALDKAAVDAMIKDAYDNGALMPEASTVIFTNSKQKQAISNIYGIAPRDRKVGGFDIETIVTDFGVFGIVVDRHMPQDTLVLADLSVCAPVHLVVPNKGVVFLEPLAKTGPRDRAMLWGALGLEYGPELYHAKLTNIG